jgi:membrane-associated phospholipid phosphatase
MKDIIEYSPAILFAATLFLLYTSYSKPASTNTYLYVYVIGYVIQLLIGHALKILIRQPRPSEDVQKFNAAINMNKHIEFDRFGMPSEHALSTFFSTVFIHFALKNNKITFIYAIISIATLYQRWESNKHTIIQLCAGGLVGAILGYACYMYAFKNIRGSLKMRPDDNGPL